MVFSISTTSQLFCARPWLLHSKPFFLYLKKPSLLPTSSSIPISISISCKTANKLRFGLTLCRAAKPQSGSVKKRPSPSPKKKRVGGGSSSKTFKLNDNDVDVDVAEDDSTGSIIHSQSYQPSPLPKPPAGFVLDSHGRVLMASSKRIATVVDSTNNFPLECVIRRVFRSSRGDECMLLCPVDTPVQILKSTNVDGWSAVSDEEVEAILPAAAYALAKIHMHLVFSGYDHYSPGHITIGFFLGFLLRNLDDGQDIDGLPNEGVEITCFHLVRSKELLFWVSSPRGFMAVGRTSKMKLAIIEYSYSCKISSTRLGEHSDFVDETCCSVIASAHLLDLPNLFTDLNDGNEFLGLLGEELERRIGLLGIDNWS
ncbi:hypothetical protein HHK36_008942 [Tetracentron sinense]|uniref:Uncharacterized protein n=1 Tax=Tetracentron sinense TaxID=13715 RepID=A0A834ZEE7_TETSI|nr:hypothetical protein HHK36_008942 [Tetracentron sinense]